MDGTETHMRLLGKLCRRCGNTSQQKMFPTTGTDAASGTKYSELLYRIFMIDIANDKKEVHPNQFCSNCQKTMIYHSQVSATEGRRALLLDSPVKWEPHKEKDCFTCSKGGRGGYRKRKQKRGGNRTPRTSSAPAAASSSSSSITEQHSYAMAMENSPRKRFAKAHSSKSRASQRTVSFKTIGPLDACVEKLTGKKRASKRKHSESQSPHSHSKKTKIEIRYTSLEEILNESEILSRYPSDLVVNLEDSVAKTELTCELCNGILDQPVRTAPCAHNFCLACMTVNLHAFGPTCPTCGMILDDVTNCTPELLRMLDNLQLKCCNTDCPKTSKYNAFIGHVQVCQYGLHVDKATTSMETPKRPGRPKAPILDASQASKNLHLKTLKKQVDDFVVADGEVSNREEVVIALAVNMLTSNPQTRQLAEKVNALYKGKDQVGLSAKKCLAIRVTRFLSTDQYRIMAASVNDAKGYRDWQSLNELQKVENTLLPGSTKFTLDPPSSCENLSSSVEPIDVTCGYPTHPSLYPLKLQGCRWNFHSAVATALEDIDEYVDAGMSHTCQHKDPKLEAEIKFGDDGMGDIKVKKGSEAGLVDKCFRWSFSILKVTCSCGHKVYEEGKPGSEKCCRPVLIARADESSTDVTYMLKPLLVEMEHLKKSTMSLVVGTETRCYTFKLLGTMYDEKRVRMIQGYGASGSEYLCTLCDLLRKDAAKDPTNHQITRSTEMCEARYNDRKFNTEGLNTDMLYSHCQGQTGLPQCELASMMDATHCNINIGGTVLKAIYAHEVSHSSKKKLTGKKYKEACKKLATHLKESIKLGTPMMADGNYARRLVEQKTVDAVSSVIPPDRQEALDRVINQYRLLRPVWCSNTPNQDYKALVDAYPQNGAKFAQTLKTDFPYVTFTNYLHKMIAHVPELVSHYHSIAIYSSESHEAGNKVTRREHLHRSRQSSKYEWRDCLKIYWLYTSKRLQGEIKEANTGKYKCGLCGSTKHTKIRCPQK